MPVVVVADPVTRMVALFKAGARAAAAAVVLAALLVLQATAPTAWAAAVVDVVPTG
jgi:hypothetical protein